MPDAMPYVVHSLELGPMANFVYIIEDVATRRAAVVDPAWDTPRIERLIEQRSLKITDILLTHSHHDHINGIDEILRKSDAQVHLLKPEAAFWGRELKRPSLHHGGDAIALGETSIDVLHTPGHTPGSACYRLNDRIITGDTLFVFGCGRCDLKGGDPEQMFETLKTMQRELPDDIKILPGHNYAEKPVSTLSEQKQGNPFLHFQDLGRFVHYRMHYHDRHRHEPYGPVAPGDEMPD